VSNYFCRYCDIKRSSFESSPLLCGNKRTEQSFLNHLQELENTGTNSEFGIKSNSPFNQLSFFHVCQPGLPPCLGHGLFEGIVSCDLSLLIGHLVEEKHLNYTQLNRCKDQFSYQGNDAQDKPADVSPGSRRLSGLAVQNWCFLRLLPLLIGDRIRNPCENAAWQLVLQLREIVEFICAPAITTDQVAYLKILIEEYIYFRRQLFPNEPLKPKHHIYFIILSSLPTLVPLFAFGHSGLRVSTHSSKDVLGSYIISRTSAGQSQRDTSSSRHT